MNRQAPEAVRPMPPRLQVGGTLIPGRHIYIPRPEDEQLFGLLSAGEYVNILSSRQVGKSSLMLRTAFRLREHGHRFAVVNLHLAGYTGGPAKLLPRAAWGDRQAIGVAIRRAGLLA